MRTRGDQYQGMLQVGQKVHSILYGGRDGIISKITGQQNPESIQQLGRGCVVMGGRAYVDVVFEEYITRGIPESIIRGVQWFIMDEIANSDEIIEWNIRANMRTQTQMAEEEKIKNERDERRKSLPAKYPYLESVNPLVKISKYALGAKNIREELKRAFPGIKFKVRSEGYSGGCSIDIHWTDGPAQSEVEKITGKYEQGHFDGMQDLYEYDHNNVWPDVFGGARHVMEDRAYSTAFIQRIANKLGVQVTFDQYGAYACQEDNGNYGAVRCELSRTLAETSC